MELNNYFDESNIESVDERIDGERVLAGLSARDRRVIYLYFSDYTQDEIARMMGCCQSTISRILASLHKTPQKVAVVSETTYVK